MDRLKKLSGTIDGCGTGWVVRHSEYVKQHSDAMAEIAELKERLAETQQQCKLLVIMGNSDNETIDEQAAHIERLEDDVTDIRDIAGCQLRNEYPNELGGWSELYSKACDAIDSTTAQSLSAIQADAMKKAYWQAFETARCFPDDNSISDFWDKWQEQLRESK